MLHFNDIGVTEVMNSWNDLQGHPRSSETVWCNKEHI